MLNEQQLAKQQELIEQEYIRHVAREHKIAELMDDEKFYEHQKIGWAIIDAKYRSDAEIRDSIEMALGLRRSLGRKS